MNTYIIRLIFTGTFALTALLGGISIEFFTDQGVPNWLVGVIGAAGGYMFGNVQVNGLNGKKRHNDS